jgi:hypothetical protein
MDRAVSDTRSTLFPRVGELWNCESRTAIIAGNSISSSGRIWIMDSSTGERGDARPELLELRVDRLSLSEGELLQRFANWARQGNSDAMWWMAWWFEGVNHPKSIWYYVAALRADPKGHGWAQARIMSDARSAFMCRGVVEPDLAFLDNIPELRGERIGRDWKSAVELAEVARHQPAYPQRATRVSLVSKNAPARH